jgi:hypothetical protein
MKVINRPDNNVKNSPQKNWDLIFLKKVVLIVKQPMEYWNVGIMGSG